MRKCKCKNWLYVKLALDIFIVTTSPEIWTHIFELSSLVHKIYIKIVSCFVYCFFFKLLIICPKMIPFVSFHRVYKIMYKTFFQFSIPLPHSTSIRNYFTPRIIQFFSIILSESTNCCETKTSRSRDPSIFQLYVQISRVESVITNRYEIIRRREVNARLGRGRGVHTTAMVISRPSNEEKRRERCVRARRPRITWHPATKRNETPHPPSLSCAQRSMRRETFLYVHAHAHARPPWTLYASWTRVNKTRHFAARKLILPPVTTGSVYELWLWNEAVFVPEAALVPGPAAV